MDKKVLKQELLDILINFDLNKVDINEAQSQIENLFDKTHLELNELPKPNVTSKKEFNSIQITDKIVCTNKQCNSIPISNDFIERTRETLNNLP